MRAEYRLRRDTALEILKRRGRESAYVPGGAFYLPVDISSSGKCSFRDRYASLN
jgi:aspartate/methionine/tyrosine aminotransferase